MQRFGRQRAVPAEERPEEQAAGGLAEAERSADAAMMGENTMQNGADGILRPQVENPLAPGKSGMAEVQLGTVEKPIGEEQVKDAEAILQRYKDGKVALEQRIVENEKWYRMRHWDVVGRSRNAGDPEPASAWLLNSILNKHADAMDNIPGLTVLPREESDKADAKVLTSILPVIMEQNDWEDTYSDMWWYKLKHGTGVLGAFWDNSKQNGLGDITIRQLDLLNLFWEPGIKDIQQSRNVFHVELMDKDIVSETWPEMEGKLGGVGGTVDVAKYANDDTIDTQDKVLVVDWYYKRKSESGRSVLHYCKFCSGHVLYASENEEAYRERGYYDHAKYPFVFDTLFPTTDSPAGFGYIDIMKSPQMYIDKLDQAILKNAVIGARPRWFARTDGDINEKEYADLSKDFVHWSGSGNPQESIMQIQVPQMSQWSVSARNQKVEELKETSGNRDFSQGGTAAGVSAASAIAALQEAGSKLSRDMIKGGYRAFTKIAYLCIELIRQFYDEPRQFRIIGEDGGMEFANFSGAQIREQQMGDTFMEATRVPYFDVSVAAQKASPFSVVAQNERAKELYQLGFFRPDVADQALLALDMMSFEGIEGIKNKISENGTMLQQLQQLQQLTLAMAQQLDGMQGSNFTQQVAAMMGGGMGGGAPAQTGEVNKKLMDETETNALGEATNAGRRTMAGAARAKAAERSTPK